MKTPFRRPSLYLCLAVTFFVTGWILVGTSLYLCNATQRVMDGMLVWSLLAIGLMGNVYAAVLVAMARAPRDKNKPARPRVIIHGHTKWLDEKSGQDRPSAPETQSMRS